ncbi:MAG: chemotaxis protein CheW [Desulfuromonadaceae bacterium]
MTPKKQNISEIRQVLEDLRRDYWQSLDTVEVEEKATREFLVFRMGGQRFAIAANTVREVVRLPARLVPVPRVAGHIRGLFNLRGQVFAVSDLGLFLGLAAIEPEGMIIFLDLGQVFSRADFVIDEKVE